MANVLPACLLLALLVLTPALLAHPEPCPVLQDIGELCMQSVQCKSGCCHRDRGLSLARCAPRATESQECSPKNLHGVYYKCPCETGLSCDANRTIVGTITNRNFGVCRDPQDL
uniref:Colipase n=1 Tax=Taeniopygia guttata TaxID=59729 RepID=A0A674G8B9_TAEGU